MNLLAHEFSAEQRRVLDRYTVLLGSVHTMTVNIPVVFERRRSGGHALAVLASDSRLNNVPFNERYLQGFWERTDEVRQQCIAFVLELAKFTSESLQISKNTSRNTVLSQVDFNLYSLSRSPTWILFPPTDVSDLVHELVLRLYRLRAMVRQLKYTIVDVHDESFGFKSVFAKAMDHRSCQCHAQPTVVQELFRERRTQPIWDEAYSSSDPLVQAVEYKAGVVGLFNAVASISMQVGVFLEETDVRMDLAIYELLTAERVSKLSQLNVKLAATKEQAEEFMAMLNHLERWLRH
ncbi:hypothetical protein CXF97_08905 [Pseudomonas sp. Choline-02u-1]|uniref:hypothetical protein n=1 Tax=Pseudomonas sp. Choline-02u-1 TaxID=2058307 RepID=UPI000C34DC96|nr:hypothetical protein [Pseudomonas sp. Choline-02u-1]PKH83147.1 hypothetical protein CXF97_08905 [Pseudomonas sp. Choline-02u-1]